MVRYIDRKVTGQINRWIDRYMDVYIDVCIFYREIDALWRDGSIDRQMGISVDAE